MTETLDQLEQSRSLIQEPVILREEASLGIQDRIHNLYDLSVNAIQRTSLKLGASALLATATVMGVGTAEAASLKTKHLKPTMAPVALIKDVVGVETDINGGGWSASAVKELEFNSTGYTFNTVCIQGVENVAKSVETLTEITVDYCAWVNEPPVERGQSAQLAPNYFTLLVSKFGTAALNSAKPYFKKSLLANVGPATSLNATHNVAHVFYETMNEARNGANNGAYELTLYANRNEKPKLQRLV